MTTSIRKKVWIDMAPEHIPSTLSLFPEFYAVSSTEDRVLDIGCGDGRTVAHLAEQGYETLTGIDLNVAALVAARQRFSGAVSPPAFVAGDATALPFQTDLFDLVVMQAFLTVIVDESDRLRCFREARRVLVPGGRLYVADFARTERLDLYKQRYLSSRFTTGYEGTFPVVDVDTGKTCYFAHHFTKDEIPDVGRTAGFKTVTCDLKSEGFQTRSGNIIDGYVAVLRKEG